MKGVWRSWSEDVWIISVQIYGLQPFRHWAPFIDAGGKSPAVASHLAPWKSFMITLPGFWHRFNRLSQEERWQYRQWEIWLCIMYVYLYMCIWYNMYIYICISHMMYIYIWLHMSLLLQSKACNIAICIMYTPNKQQTYPSKPFRKCVAPLRLPQARPGEYHLLSALSGQLAESYLQGNKDWGWLNWLLYYHAYTINVPNRVSSVCM